MTKAEAFKNLIKSDELNDEIELMREELVQLIVNSDDDEVSTREGAYVRIKVINEIMARQGLEDIVNGNYHAYLFKWCSHRHSSR